MSEPKEASPGLLQAMIKAIMGMGTGAASAPDARAASQQMAKRMPSAVMPNAALAEAERRRAMMDAMTRGE